MRTYTSLAQILFTPTRGQPAERHARRRRGARRAGTPRLKFGSPSPSLGRESGPCAMFESTSVIARAGSRGSLSKSAGLALRQLDAAGGCGRFRPGHRGKLAAAESVARLQSSGCIPSVRISPTLVKIENPSHSPAKTPTVNLLPSKNLKIHIIT